VLIAAAIVSLVPCFIIDRVTLGSSMFWVLCTVGLASPLLFLLVILHKVLSGGWHPGKREVGPTGANASARRPRLTVLPLMVAMAIITVMCWLAALLGTIWWGAFHEPTYAELAAGLRDNSARWERLAAETPSLGKEYRRIAESSRRAADRLDQRAKETPR